MAKSDQENPKKIPIDDSPNELAAEADQANAEDMVSMESLNQALFEVADLKTKLLRWQADFQNLQRRAAREVLESRQNADADFAKSLLSVLDHFDMALSVNPAKTDAKGVLDGMKITHDELKKILVNRGIESYDPTGQPFDPHQHEAVMQEASPDHAPMMVTQTFQQGYKLGNRILRPAKVKVSK